MGAEHQLLEYAELDFSISSHAYGSMFFLMTGFHGLHVAGGIAFMIGVIGLVSGGSEAPPAPPVRFARSTRLLFQR